MGAREWGHEAMRYLLESDVDIDQTVTEDVTPGREEEFTSLPTENPNE